MQTKRLCQLSFHAARRVTHIGLTKGGNARGEIRAEDYHSPNRKSRVFHDLGAISLCFFRHMAILVCLRSELTLHEHSSQLEFRRSEISPWDPVRFIEQISFSSKAKRAGPSFWEGTARIRKKVATPKSGERQ
jgi:hypothetical protein